MPIQFDSFDQQKVDNLKKYLDSFAAKGKPKKYEIHVDGMKAVNKTDDPEEFFKFEDYMTPVSNSIKIIIYCSDNSCRNDQYVYALRAKTQQEALDMGLDGFVSQSYSKADIEAMLRKKEKQRAEMEELENLRRKILEAQNQLKGKDEELAGLKTTSEKQKTELLELENLKRKNAEQEKAIQTLEDEFQTAQKVIEAQSKQIEKREVNLGNVGARILQALAKNNAGKLARMTGIEGLAGFLEDEETPTGQTTQPPPHQETEASFKKKESGASGIELSEDEKQFLALFKDLNRYFSPAEMEQLIEIIQHLSADKTQLRPMLELLQQK